LYLNHFYNVKPNIYNMKKLLIPFLMIAAVVTASAHCGSCGTGEAHAEKAACPADCSKPCCAKDAKCDKSEKKACSSVCAKPCCASKEEAAAPVKACCPADAAKAS
jgi:hypothetical protein